MFCHEVGFELLVFDVLNPISFSFRDFAGRERRCVKQRQGELCQLLIALCGKFTVSCHIAGIIGQRFITFFIVRYNRFVYLNADEIVHLGVFGNKVTVIFDDLF